MPEGDEWFRSGIAAGAPAHRNGLIGACGDIVADAPGRGVPSRAA